MSVCPCSIPVNSLCCWWVSFKTIISTISTCFLAMNELYILCKWYVKDWQLLKFIKVIGSAGTGNPDGLGVELLETLVKMAPTKEEELILREYNNDMSKVGSAEQFLKSVLDIPFAFKRVDAMLYRANFESEVRYLRKSFETLEVNVHILFCYHY